MVNIFRKRPNIKRYQRFRKTGKDLHHKIIEHYVDDKVLEKAARELGLGKNRQLELDSEDELSVLMEYAIYEIQHEGKNFIQHYQKEVGGKNFIERSLLDTKATAKTSLFAIEDILRDSYCLALRDLITDRNLTLTDVNFSQTASTDLILFIRPIETDEFTMTSGISFPFASKLEKELVERWHKLEWKGPAERFARFFKLYKSKGFETFYIE
jgi:hypothetical protein